MLEKHYDVRRSSHYKSVHDDLKKLEPVHLLILDLGYGGRDYVGHKCVPKIVPDYPHLKIIVYSGIVTDLDAQDQALNIARELLRYPQVVGFLSPADLKSKVLFEIHKALGTSEWLQDGEVWLLHISDMQFGGAGLPSDGEGLASAIGEAVQGFAISSPHPEEAGERKCPYILLLTGDLTEHGRPREFEEAWKFATCLSERLATQRPDMKGVIGKHNLIAIPGNHDINWDISIAQNFHLKNGRARFEYQEGRDNRNPALEFLQRFSWMPFCEQGWGVPDKEGFWAWKPGYRIINLVNELKLLIVCINSSLWGVDHIQQHADIPTRVWLEIQTELNACDPRKEAARILLSHHSAAYGVDPDDQLRVAEFPDEPEQLINNLSRVCNFTAMFTGHIHRLAANYLETNNSKRSLVTVGAGTARSKDRKEYKNPQFNIVKIGGLSADDNKFSSLVVYPFHFDGTKFCSYNAFGDGFEQWKAFDLRY
jgi:hypothetical protein